MWCGMMVPHRIFGYIRAVRSWSRFGVASELAAVVVLRNDRVLGAFESVQNRVAV